MLDCGMHMGYNDERRFPDFSYISRSGRLTQHLDCVLISHFHLDHCGALPYFSEMVGYDGPIYMTHPTKAIAPILLEDYRKITVERKGETNFFTSQMIKDCMKKVIPINLHQSIKVDDELEIKAYYAGHVLGAVMFHMKVGTESVVYTGDYNMTPDRHLGSAWIDKCKPNVLITESTYATTIRDSKRCRERDFLKKVHDCIDKGGKVLIPVFALGRAQELCILLETYWDRMNLKAPIYFSTGLTEKANHYYKLFITWTNQKIKNTFVQRNMFEFEHIKAFDRSYIDQPGPMVVFATPGMLHAGLSLQIFKKWASNENNMVVIPGYCVAGTVGHKVLAGQKKIELDKKNVIDVKLSVQYMSFSAHADASGIMQLIRQAEPKSVVLVHGESGKMDFLRQKIMQEFNIQCYKPANGESIAIPTTPSITVDMAISLLKRKIESVAGPDVKRAKLTPNNNHLPLQGVLVMKDNSFRLLESEEAMKELGLTPHQLRFTSTVTMEITEPSHVILDRLHSHLGRLLPNYTIQRVAGGCLSIDSVLVKLSGSGSDDRTAVQPTTCSLLVSWAFQDEELGSHVLSLLRSHKEILSAVSGSKSDS
ncbi:integrator complex subunit 11 isoform X2 [Exaiptasia diaphana]|nr:integrator complex subunit 11 isoform X2 [Exaiptasia diaphana]